MAFFKFRSRGQPANEGRNASVAAAPAESVDAMRRRARHRLLGAAVLVLVGVIGFPLLFDTQPRPVAVDIPIEIPDRNKVAPLPAPVAPAAPVAQAPAPAPAPAAPAPDNRTRVASNSGTSGGIITETADGRELPSERPVAAAPPAETRPEPKPEAKPKPEPKPEVRHEPKPEPKPAVAAKPPADDGARARALLDGKPPAAAAAAAVKPAAATDDDGRFVVQVGAFAEAEKARDVRQKLEKAGLKTYTNVAKTADGERTRVRVGPFASRAEAERAAGRVKGLSLPAAVLSL